MDKEADEEAFDDIFSDTPQDEVDPELAKDLGVEPEKEPEEPQKAEEEKEPEPQVEPEPQAEEKQDHRVPLPELLETRKGKQEAEERARQAEERLQSQGAQLQALQSQLNGFQQAVLSNQQATQPEPAKIDIYEDPEGFQKNLTDSIFTTMRRNMLDASDAAARRYYGSDVVDAAIQAAQASGEIQTLLGDPDPGSAIVEWHKRQKVIQETGGDLEKYRESIETGLREQIKTELLAELGVAQTNEPQPTPPPSLTRTASAGNGAEPVLTDSEAFNDIFGPK